MRFFLSLLFISLSLEIVDSFNEKPDYLEVIREYLIDKGELSVGEKASLYVVEILKLNEISDNNYGIYKVGVFSDHGLAYLFLLNKDRNEYSFLDIADLSNAIECVLDFMDNASIPDKVKVDYIREVIRIYNQNMNTIPWM